MRNDKSLRPFLPLTVLAVCFTLTAHMASAQRPEGPGQGGPRPCRQEGPGGQRPGRRGGPGGFRRPGAEAPPSGGNGGEVTVLPTASARELAPGVTRVPVVFSGGHETDPRDGGRPVVLIAAALGVPTEVFREAFSHVRPARAGSEPAPDQVRQNKDALMNALSRYGITNEKLDSVSNYYRYVRSRNELWSHTPAVANALVKNGVVVGFEIVRGGSGYSSPPTVSVPNLRNGIAVAKIAFGKTPESNGSIVSISVPQN